MNSRSTKYTNKKTIKVSIFGLGAIVVVLTVSSLIIGLASLLFGYGSKNLISLFLLMLDIFLWFLLVRGYGVVALSSFHIPILEQTFVNSKEANTSQRINLFCYCIVVLIFLIILVLY